MQDRYKEPSTIIGRQENPAIAIVPSAEEIELVQMCQHGNHEAFGPIYEQHVTYVKKIIGSKIESSQHVEDLAQDVFLNALRNMPAFKHEKPIKYWLGRIARNIVISYFRDQSRDKTADYVGLEQLPDDRTGDLFARAEDRTEIGKMRRALSQLKDDQREVIRLRFVEGLETEEIARILGTGKDNTRLVIHRAVSSLRQAFNA